MALEVECPNCGHPYKVKDELAGRKMRCRECSAVISVPAADDDFDLADEELVEEAPKRRARSAGLPAPSPAKPKKDKSRKKSQSGMSTTTKVVLGLAASGLVCVLLCCGWGYWVVSRFRHQIAGDVPVPAGQTFDQWRAGFQTKLIKVGPAPQEYDLETPPTNVQEILYPSAGRILKAWVYRPPGVEDPRPALVFFHGGFAFGSGDLLETCVPFMDAGYVVMAPMLRGENGNPGNYELFLGEVDDARAATQWLAQQPYVEKGRIYTFGHSIGGGVSAVLGLLNDVPIRHSGSSGGLYDHTTFLAWQIDQTVPFENTPAERSVRLLLGHVNHLQHHHYAYIGTEDEGFHDSAESMQQEAGAAEKLTVKMIPGDHFTSFDPAIRDYLQIAEQDRALTAPIDTAP
ncbi:MAG: CocE/NonD family hydrolase [Planctomycetaceae bacterium]|nr:CocE/NonD family hydrolase [Planctomycetaceae bacterium]